MRLSIKKKILCDKKGWMIWHADFSGISLSNQLLFSFKLKITFSEQEKKMCGS